VRTTSIIVEVSLIHSWLGCVQAIVKIYLK